MPSTKKAPIANARKKMTASARVRISTVRAKRTSDKNGSYIQETTKRTLSNVHNLPSPCPDSGPACQETANEAILTYLKKIDNTTKVFGQQVQAIEESQSLYVTPIRQWSHSHEGDPPNNFLFPSESTGHQNHNLLRFQEPVPSTLHNLHEDQQPNRRTTLSQQSALQGDMGVSQPPQEKVLDRESIIPGVDALRQNHTYHRWYETI